MQATPTQVDLLKKLQELDRVRLQSRLAIEKLPQPQQAQEIREKLEGVVGKLAQVRKIHDDASQQLEKLLREDEELTKKQEETQAAIDDSSGDYRIVTSLTRDMEGMAKRRETVSFEMGKVEARIEEVSGVLRQAEQARDSLVAKEEALAAAYRKEGGELKAAAELAEAQREKLAAELPEEIAQEYEHILAKCKGIALSVLEGDRCSACRNILDPNRMLQVRKEAPLAHCPHCGRIIVVEGEMRS